MHCIRILLVEDFKPWRRFISEAVEQEPQLLIICEVSNGLEAVQKAKELKPDLILMDIGLPKLNGIAAARQIRTFPPKSKILFLSQDSSAAVVREALEIGTGYIVKTDAGRELLSAIKGVMLGEQFLSSTAKGHTLEETTAELAREGLQMSALAKNKPRNVNSRGILVWVRGMRPIHRSGHGRSRDFDGV